MLARSRQGLGGSLTFCGQPAEALESCLCAVALCLGEAEDACVH